jgi:hypothetical protein
MRNWLKGGYNSQKQIGLIGTTARKDEAYFLDRAKGPVNQWFGIMMLLGEGHLTVHCLGSLHRDGKAGVTTPSKEKSDG